MSTLVNAMSVARRSQSGCRYLLQPISISPTVDSMESIAIVRNQWWVVGAVDHHVS